jgi:hypothetical protein
LQAAGTAVANNLRVGAMWASRRLAVAQGRTLRKARRAARCGGVRPNGVSRVLANGAGAQTCLPSEGVCP